MGHLLSIDNSILVEEIRFALFFGWPLSVFTDILIAPQGFFTRPYRVLLYVLLGPLGTIDIARRAIVARVQAAPVEARPLSVRAGGIVLLLVLIALLASGIAMALATRWPDWYFPVLRLHRWIGIALVPLYFAYLTRHIHRTSGGASLLAHGIFSLAVIGVLLFINPDSRFSMLLIAGALLTVVGSAFYVRRLDRRGEEGKSRGGLPLNGWLLMVMVSGVYLIPAVNSRISNNTGNYYYHLHGLLALFGLPMAAFLFLHHIRRTPRAFPWPARLAAAAVGVPFAIYALYAANQKTHAGDIGVYRNQRLFAAATAGMSMSPQAPVHAPHEWWLPEMNEVQSCERCHDVLFKQWEGSAHALSGRNISYRAVLNGLIEQGRLDDTAFCQSCHQPSLSVLADRRVATSAAAMDADQGVSCKACHLTFQIADPPRNGMTLFREEERVPGALVASAPYSPPRDEQIRDDLRLHLKGFSNSTLFGSRAFCANCHRIELPAHGARLAALVLPNPYDNGNADSASCKSCHMPYDTRNARGVRFPNHHMFGANTSWSQMLPVAIGEPQRQAAQAGDAATEAWLAGHGDRDVDYGVAALRPAFDLKLRLQRGKSQQVIVEVLNARAGHPFPVAAPDLVEVWLFTEVKTPDGTVFVSGALDDSGHLPPEARRFGATLLGSDGGPLAHHDLMGISSIGERRLLMPGQPHQERFALPQTLHYPLEIRAELRYRRASRTFTSSVIGADAPSFPVKRLAGATCRLADAKAQCAS